MWLRVKALAGRAEVRDTQETSYVIGEYEFNPSSKELIIRGQHTTLAAREAAVLVRLCRKRGRVVEASELLKELWGLCPVIVIVAGAAGNLEESVAIILTAIGLIAAIEVGIVLGTHVA